MLELGKRCGTLPNFYGYNGVRAFSNTTQKGRRVLQRSAAVKPCKAVAENVSNDALAKRGTDP